MTTDFLRYRAERVRAKPAANLAQYCLAFHRERLAEALVAAGIPPDLAVIAAEGAIRLTMNENSPSPLLLAA